MRIFVTGGTGIVGRAVVPVLREQGHDVLVMTRQASACGSPGYAFGDLSDSASMRSALQGFRPDAVAHLAWDGLPDYSLRQSLRNLETSVKFFELSADAGCKTILSTGSCWEYAARHGQLSEDAPLGGAEPFHAVKNSLRFLGESIALAHGAQFYWMRLFFVFGRGQRPQSLVPHVSASIRAGRTLQLKAPNNRHDFVFVGDVARAIASVIERRPAGSVYNVGTGRPTAVAEVVSTVGRLLGRDDAPPLSGGVAEQDFWADVSRLERDTGWRPAFDLESGLRETLREP